ncbi:hypothetical protein H5410_050982 [Solanum commersonii]|uniref:Uncharacterized protein n=1 Tax=Solanum commersonii TaxID=4109 RepID=A0A9J5WX31_SOLCO|nr:hypothetical protein H5410_050982 [Solanum commersonii]
MFSVSGEKLRVTFYHNRVVWDHYALFSRQVHSWTNIEEANLEHLWGAITTLHAMFFISSFFPPDLLLPFSCSVICLPIVCNVTFTSYNLADYIYVTINLSTTLHAMFFISSFFPPDLLLPFLCSVICLSIVCNVTLTTYSLADYIYVTIDLSTEKFDNDDMNGHIDHVLKHLRRLWNTWRGSLHMNAKSKPLKEVLKDVPQGVDKSDWEWLVKEHFLTENLR